MRTTTDPAPTQIFLSISVILFARGPLKGLQPSTPPFYEAQSISFISVSWFQTLLARKITHRKSSSFLQEFIEGGGICIFFLLSGFVYIYLNFFYEKLLFGLFFFNAVGSDNSIISSHIPLPLLAPHIPNPLDKILNEYPKSPFFSFSQTSHPSFSSKKPRFKNYFVFERGKAVCGILITFFFFYL